jgi:UDP-glucose 6-dehydrogenase
MDVTVIGCGYVGSGDGNVPGQHRAYGSRRGEGSEKLKRLTDGHCPIFEPGCRN